MYKILLGLALCVFASGNIFSQNAQKSVATEIKDLQVHSFANGYSELADNAIEFMERLAKEPTSTRGAIIIYPEMRFKGEGQCIDQQFESGSPVFEFAAKVLRLNTALSPERIVVVRGEKIPAGMASYWIVPDGAAVPAPAHVDFTPFCCCPRIAVYGVPIVKSSVRRIRFLAEVQPNRSSARFNYQWTVSSGQITSGQGTSEIEVQIDLMQQTTITATVDVAIPPMCNCKSTYSYTTKIDRN